MPPEVAVVYEFGPFRYRPADRNLAAQGKVVYLAPKPAAVLLSLLKAGGEVVRKEQIVSEVWGPTYVVETNLPYQLSTLRSALSSLAGRDEYIATVHGLGYRVVPTVTIVPRAEAPVVMAAPPPPVVVDLPPPAPVLPEGFNGSTVTDARRGEIGTVRRRPLWRVGALALTAAVAVTLVIAARERGGATDPRVVGYTALTPGLVSAAISAPLLTDGSKVYFDLGLRATSVSVEGGEPEALTNLDGFRLHDVSGTRKAFLTERRHDPGADAGLWTVAGSTGTPRRVGLLTGDEASWSADGTRIAYAQGVRLYVARSDGADSREIAILPWPPTLPRWSPDGTRLRFCQTVLSDRKATGEIWEVGADGSGLHRLLTDWAADVSVCCGNWTPDGRFYVFRASRLARSDLWVLDETTASGGGPARAIQLTKGPLSYYAPVVSADGKTIFAFGLQDHGELARWEPHVREFAPYLGGISAIWVNFSGDGQWVTYVAHPDGTLWRSRIDGTDKRQLTFPPLRVDGCAWSPDGHTIAFRGLRPDGRTRIFLISADGGKPEPLATDDVEQGIPTWSKNGRVLAFSDVPEQFGHPTGREMIHLYNVSTHALTDVPGSRGLWSSRWSPDGKSIAALTASLETQTLMLFDVDAGRWRSLKLDHVGNYTWSRDSRYIYYGTEGHDGNVPRSRLRRVRVEDGASEDIVDLYRGRYSTFTSWIWTGLSLDDSPIILRAPGGVQLYALEFRR